VFTECFMLLVTCEQTRVVLYNFAMSLIQESYDPLMRSLKGKFVREIEDIVAMDHMRFMNLAGFLMSLHRQSEEARMLTQPVTNRVFQAGAVATTLDIWSFAFVVKCCDAWLEAKNHSGLVCASLMLKEMVMVGGLSCTRCGAGVTPSSITVFSVADRAILQTLFNMEQFGDEETKALADSIKKSVFYERDILDVRGPSLGCCASSRSE
jgi:hypothetical protein